MLQQDQYEFESTKRISPKTPTLVLYNHFIYFYDCQLRTKTHTFDPNFYKFCTLRKQWYEIKTCKHPRITLSRSCVYNHKMIIFGNLQGNVKQNVLYSFSFKKEQWKKIKPKNEIHTVLLYPRIHLYPYHNMILHTFSVLKPSTFMIVETLYQFDLKQKIWTLLECSGDLPPKKLNYCTILLGDELFLISGAESNSPRGNCENTSIYSLNLKNLLWKQITNNFGPALVKYCAAAMCDGDLYLCGATRTKKQLRPILLRLDIEKLIYHNVPVDIEIASLTQVAVGRRNELYIFNCDEHASLYKIVFDSISQDQRVKLITLLELEIFDDCIFTTYSES